MQFLVLLILLAMLTASFCLAILKLMWTLFAMIIREPPEMHAKSRKAIAGWSRISFPGPGGSQRSVSCAIFWAPRHS